MSVEEAAAFLATVEAADLVTMTEQGLLATFLPLLYVPEAGELGAFRGHGQHTSTASSSCTTTAHGSTRTFVS